MTTARLAVGSLAVSLTLFISLCPAAAQPVFGPGSGRSPFDDEVWIAFSQDGFAFTAHRQLFEHASVPDVLALPGGGLLVYFVDFSQAAAATEGISAGISNDRGKTWRRERVRIEGLSSHKAVDPDAVLLPDGRIRLYYFATSPPPAGRPADPARQEGPHLVRSAISTDGIRFREEEGVRFSREGLTDPDVVRMKDGRWRMYFPVHAGERRGSVLSATSTDGLSFSEDPGTRHSFPSIPGVVVLSDGRIRLFVNVPGGIGSKISHDGLSFQDEGIRVWSTDGRGLADPSPALREDGTFVSGLQENARRRSSGAARRAAAASSSAQTAETIDQGRRPSPRRSTHGAAWTKPYRSGNVPALVGR